MHPSEWAPPGTPELNLRIAFNAQQRVGELEIPLGSNRSPWIDEALSKCGLVQPYLDPDVIEGKRLFDPKRDARGYPWCAAGAADWWREAGAETPPISARWWREHNKGVVLGPASCDGWLRWALITGRFSPIPVVGAAVLYGTRADATHIGVVLRLTPILSSIEGNTTFNSYSREGVACDVRPVTRERVVGYVHPLPIAA